MDNKKIQKKWIIISCAILAAILVIYVGVSLFLTERFLPRTTINGISCSGKTVEEVEKEFSQIYSDYYLEIIDVNDAFEVKKAQDFGLSYETTHEVANVQKMQNAFSWPVALFKPDTQELKLNASFDEAMLKEAVSSLTCMKEENQVAPVNATLAYQNGTFEVVKEVYGTQLKQDVLEQAVAEAIVKLQPSLELAKTDCYVQPTFKSDSVEVLDAQKVLNQYIATVITYDLGGIKEVLDKEKIQEWVSVNENMEPVMNEEAVKAYASTLGDIYNTPNQSQTLTTPTGKQVSIENAKKGRKVGVDAESAKLLEEIKAGTVITRSPELSQTETPDGEYGWGNTYIEVDIAQQHMWYIKNGSVVFESDVVTGKPSSSTPTGMYQILEKKTDKVLRGDKQPNGEWGYESPVSYWMRVTWSGIGFHDATWQSAFGGQRYVQGYGSHGCINMPLGNAKQLYNMISNGTKVIIHK